MATIALCGGALLLLGSALPAAAADPKPSQTEQQAFVNAVNSDSSFAKQAGMPSSVLVSLGTAVCGLLSNGKSVNYVSSTLSGSGTESSFPATFVSAVLIQSTQIFCPKYINEVRKWAGVGPATTPKASLTSLLPPESKNCLNVKASDEPTGMVGLSKAIVCKLPKLGSDSYIYGYRFDNAADYQTSLAAYNKFKSIVPATPGVACPTPNVSDNGVEPWGNETFPEMNGQVLECTMVSTKGGTTNNVPDYIWTVPTENTILGALGNPGSSMLALNTWWTKDSDT